MIVRPATSVGQKRRLFAVVRGVRASLDRWTGRRSRASVRNAQGLRVSHGFERRERRPMRRMRRRLELGRILLLLLNLITLSSIVCGFDAIRLAARGSEDDIYRAAVLLIFAMIFDMLD